VLANLAPVLPYLLMVPDSIKKPADLHRKSIAISKFGDTTDVASRNRAGEHGLKPGADHFVQVDRPPIGPPRSSAGAVQAGAVQPPISVGPPEARVSHAGRYRSAQRILRLAHGSSANVSWIAAITTPCQRYVSALMDASR